MRDHVLSPGTVVLEDGVITEIALRIPPGPWSAGVRRLHGPPRRTWIHRRPRPWRRRDATRSTARPRSRGSPSGCLVMASRPSARRQWPARLRRSRRCWAQFAPRAKRAGGARVLPAHLESNFINPGLPRGPAARVPSPSNERPNRWTTSPARRSSSEIHAASGDVGIMTIAPEIDGAIDLIRRPGRTGHLHLARALRRHLRRGAGGHRRWRPACDASFQSHAAAQPPRTWPRGRRSRERGD